MDQFSEGSKIPLNAKQIACLLPGEILAQNRVKDPELEEQVRIIRDILESQTNGMFHSGGGGFTGQLRADSPMKDWVYLIRALDCLYKGEWDRMEGILSSIDPESGPGCLVDVLAALGEIPGGKERRASFSPAEKRLYNQVAEDRRFVKSLAIQLEDTLEAGDEYFRDFSLLAIREVREMDESIALRLALWCLECCYREDFDYVAFLDGLKELLGPSLAMRLSAAVLSPKMPGEGSKCWLLSLLYRLREEAFPSSGGRNEAGEYLWISSHYLSVFLRDNPGEEDIPGTNEELFQLLALLRRELSETLAVDLPSPEKAPPGELTAGWARSLAPELAPAPGPQGPKPEVPADLRKDANPRDPREAPALREKNRKKPPKSKQLELFSGPYENSPKTAPGGGGNTPPASFFGPPRRHDGGPYGLLSLQSLESPREMKELIRTRPRYVGPEPWFGVIRQKRRSLG